ncbi:Hsp33 family molecular chaperone HslO [Bdellovibrio bacteriovorus]|uniref:Hsp33 family molecular chaperone HslO n=1 Tax=Bdellovibrio bacteriovorus TaxID=959 RepID=UPI0021CE6C28|nr:Hsp33 family molecular chaperone HslO [Bdellovibrio bacteriovorus]UXR65498.1 Hsp33 family molecular chaperone HslO [Bdellovibrio bacteriovorus]
MSKERVHRFVSKDLTLRIAAVNATEVVRHMQNLQNTYPLATVAVGRSMVGALLMAAQLKDDQMVGLLFRGNGPLGSIYAEASYNGHVRGYTANPQYQPANYDNGLSLKEAIGIGLLSVARHQPFQKQPFQGTVELVSGEIGQDIAHYLHQSHQIRSLVSLGVYLDTYGKVQSAGGVLIEVMPGVDEALVEKIQKNYDDKKPNISKMLLDGASAEDLIKPFLDGIAYEELEHDHPVEYFCPCTKDRVMRALELLSNEDLEDMIEKQEPVHVTCQVCGRPYDVSIPEVKALKEKLYKSSLH